jgi:hypothetical protein
MLIFKLNYEPTNNSANDLLRPKISDSPVVQITIQKQITP